MNIVAILAFFCAVLVLTFAIHLGSPLSIFIDPASFMIVPVTTMMLLIATFGFGSVFSAFKSGFRSVFMANGESADPEESRERKMVAMCGSKYATLTGFIGATIGLVTMFHQMSDPTAIGPAMAVALLSAFYAALMIMFVFYPMARQAAQQEFSPHTER